MSDARPAVIAAGGVFLPAHMCGPTWRVLREWADRHRANGGQIRPDFAAALDAMRAAAQAYLATVDVRTNEHGSAGAPNIDASSPGDAGTVGTGELAGRLGVTEQHARRLARSAGITSVRRGVWRAKDAAALIAARRMESR